MKKWTGGMCIVALAAILVLRYSLIGIQPQKQSAYDFFRNHPTDDSQTKDSGTIKSSKMEVKKVSKPLKKPPLKDIEGLSNLYASENISKEESKALLVWAHMRMLLSRNDTFPETADGVKEASIAWKDLLSTIEKKKASKFSNSNNSDDKNCPYSVSTLDKAAMSDGVILELPCGLVGDSSITLVGIPNGENGSFQIEIIGSQLFGEPTPPINLHFNVSLPGDNMTEEPFIVQNTWTSEAGWGKEERCPAHGSANIIKGMFHYNFLFSQICIMSEYC